MNKIIYLITDGTLTNQNYSAKSHQTLEIIQSAIENEISFIQIREKNLSTRLVFELTLQAVQLAKDSATKILVNDRADVAFAANADGVHLTSTSIYTTVTRKQFPKNFTIGVSTHSLDEVIIAKNQGADFVVFSPIFASPNKGEPLGTEVLRTVCNAVNPFPVLALGGIDGENYKQILEIADGFAAIRFLQTLENLRKLKDEHLSINRRS